MQDEETQASDPWLYGEEASLYSIEEDSREDRATSEFTPQKTAVLEARSRSIGAGVLPPSAVSTKRGKANDPSADAVEIGVVDSDDEYSMTKASDSELHLFYERRRRRRRMFIVSSCLICLLLVAIIVSVTITQMNKTQSTGSVAGVQGASGGGGTGVSPSISPSSAPSVDMKYRKSQTYVFNAVNQCSGVKTFFDSNTPQGQAFQLLVEEVYEKAILDVTTGTVTFDSMHSGIYLREKYALEMLYVSLSGDTWIRKSNWMTPSDPCGWQGLSCASGRSGSSCAVTNLSLGALQK